MNVEGRVDSIIKGLAQY